MTASQDWALPESTVDEDGAVFEVEWEDEPSIAGLLELQASSGRRDAFSVVDDAIRAAESPHWADQIKSQAQRDFLHGLKDVHEWQDGVPLSYCDYPVTQRDRRTNEVRKDARWRQAKKRDKEFCGTGEQDGSFCLGASRSMAVRATFGLSKPTYKKVLTDLNARIESARRSRNMAAEAAGLISRIVSHQHSTGPLSQYNEDVEARYGITNVKFQSADRKAALAALQQGARVMVDLTPRGWHWVMVALSPDKKTMWVVDPYRNSPVAIRPIKLAELGNRAEIIVDKTTRALITPDRAGNYNTVAQPSGGASEVAFEPEWESEPMSELESPFAEVGAFGEWEAGFEEIEQEPDPEFEEWTGETAAGSAVDVVLPVPQLIALWEAAAGLNERIRHLVVQALDQRPDTSVALTVEHEYQIPPAVAGIKDLIDQGLAENDIANEVFYQRNPKLRGTVIRAGTSQARQWSSIRDGEVRPAAKRLLGRWIVDPLLLAVYFSQYEGDSRVPDTATSQFLTRSPLRSMGRTLRDRVIGEWRSGKPPLTTDRLYRLAYEISGHAASAMLLCHNVTRAFSRGGTTITWDRVPSAPDTYSDGKKTWTPKVVHPDGKLIKTQSSKYKRELPSIYYLLFSAKEFGTDDPGDWYHYFVAATMAAFGAAGELSPSAPVRESADHEDQVRSDKRVDKVVDTAYPLLVRDRVSDLQQQMSNPDLLGVPGYRGWVLANVMSFLEGGHYGGAQPEVARESRFHLRGALAGLRAAGHRPGKDWVWYVPGAKSLSKEDLVLGFALQYKVAEALDAAGKQFRRPAKSPK